MGILLLGIACRHRLIDEMNTIWGMKRSFSLLTLASLENNSSVT